jgi:hypothetical protein
MWRQFSAQRALQQNQANFMSQNEAPDMGVTPGQIPPSQGQPAAPDLGAEVGQHLGQRLPEGGYRPPDAPALSMNGLVADANNQDWRMRIAQMANTLHNNPSFQTLQGGPAEAAMNRLLHVQQATRHVQAMARQLGARRPSRAVPRGIMRTKAY